MTERRRPARRGRGARSQDETAPEQPIEADPSRDASEPAPAAEAPAPKRRGRPRKVKPEESASAPESTSPAPEASRSEAAAPEAPCAAPETPSEAPCPSAEGGADASGGRPWERDRGERGDRFDRNDRNGRGRRGRRRRGRGRGGFDRAEGGEGGDRPHRPHRPQGGFDRERGGQGDHDRDQDRTPVVLVADGETSGWFDPAREAGFVRRAPHSYLNEPGDAWVPPQLIRQFGLRRGDAIVARTGHDHRGRLVVAEIAMLNGAEPQGGVRRPDFQTLIASYPDRRLTLETGRSAKGGPELTRRAIDLIAPIGYGQRALIVAPARAGKTMLMQAITEGIAINHPQATLLILLVDERPEEVSEAISWGVGEVVASSFDQPAKRHVEVVEMVIERSRRLVEQGQDVIIVLDSLTRMARAFNTAERGTGRTLSGGLDTSAMAKPKAFFGSARNIAPQHGGGSLTIIATALVETGSRMDDVIFEEFKGTGNCEIKLDRSLAEKRIFPAFDIATSGTRREEKLYKAEQIDAIYTLRRGLQQMPPQAAMEWLIKRIAGTTSNDALLAGL